jgi:hypothetical protein
VAAAGHTTVLAAHEGSLVRQAVTASALLAAAPHAEQLPGTWRRSSWRQASQRSGGY